MIILKKLENIKNNTRKLFYALKDKFLELAKKQHIKIAIEKDN